MREVKLWNENWKFRKMDWDEADCGAVLQGAEDISLPHTWYRDGEYYQGDAVYQKIFRMRPEKDRHVFLLFEGVEKICRVLVNGHLTGSHKGGYSSFAVEIGMYLNPDADNILTVLVNNEKGDTVNPISGDFAVFGGICRSVKMIITEHEHFDIMYYGTKGIILRTELKDTAGVLRLQPHICGCGSKKPVVRYQVFDMGGMRMAEKTVCGETETIIPIPSPHLWNGKEDPYLYKVSAQLVVGGEIRDEVTLHTGFRAMELDAQTGFYLNGKHMKLNGVAKHQDTAEVFSAASKENWDTDFRLIMEIGANALRLSHYQHPQEVYDLCDRNGLIVWAEIPMLKMSMDKELLENADQQLRELILQNIHHPSICFWGIQNEIAIFGEDEEMYPEVERLNQAAKRLDDGRITVCANLNTVKSDSRLNRITDAVGYNLYYGWYYGELEDYDISAEEFHRVNPDVPLGLSEYGVDCNLSFHSSNPVRKDYSEEYQMLYHETVYPIIRDKQYIWGSFVWNMFDFTSPVRDEGGIKYRNNKGLVTYDRQIRKDAFYYYKAQWSEEPFVHITGKRFRKRKQYVIDIKVYSNLKEVNLSVNGKEYSVSSGSGIFLFQSVELKDGENRVTASAGNITDRAVFLRTDEDTPEYVFVDPYPGLNVKNWYEDELEKEKLFPQDAYSILDTINDLMKCGQVMSVIDKEYRQVGTYMRGTIGSFTLEQMCVHAKTLVEADELKTLNNRLIQIKKRTNSID